MKASRELCSAWRLLALLCVLHCSAAHAQDGVVIKEPPPRTATYVVAASDTPAPVRADYVCDGANDEVQIQAAIDDAVAAGGGTVHLRKGNYRIDANIIMRSEITLRGEGWKTRLYIGDTATPYPLLHYDTTQTDAALKVSPHTNITIRDLELDGMGGQAAGFSFLDKGIRIKFVDGLLVDNVYCHDFGATGIGVDYARRARVSNCIANGNGADHNNPGIDDWQPGGNGIGVFSGAWEVEEVAIVNCHAEGNGNQGIMWERGDSAAGRGGSCTNCVSYANKRGGRVAGCDGVTWTNCFFSNNTDDGFSITTAPHVGSVGDEENTDIRFIGCEFNDNLDRGCAIREEAASTFAGPYCAVGVTFVACDFSGNSEDGLYLNYCDRVVVQGCKTNNNDRGGITILPVHGDVRDVVIASHESRHNGQDPAESAVYRAGIGIGYTANQVHQVTIRDLACNPTDGASTQLYGISFTNPAAADPFEFVQIRNANLDGQATRRIELASPSEVLDSNYRDIKGVVDGDLTADVP